MAHIDRETLRGERDALLMGGDYPEAWRMAYDHVISELGQLLDEERRVDD
jgi:hypothetical protein